VILSALLRVTTEIVIQKTAQRRSYRSGVRAVVAIKAPPRRISMSISLSRNKIVMHLSPFRRRARCLAIRSAGERAVGVSVFMPDS
jgi:hypothetical protein